MLIGFTYDLRDDYLAAGYDEETTAEFDRQSTIDAIRDAIVEQGHQVDLIGRATQLVQRLAAGDRWDLVFNICEGLNGFGREAQVPTLLEMYGIPFTFSDSLVMALSLHKGMTKSVLSPHGVPTPKHVVVHSLNDLPGISLNYPLFAKPVAEGTGKGITARCKITSPAELTDICQALLGKFKQPVLVEEFCPGREFTVGILGTGDAARVLGTYEVLLRPHAEAEVYSFDNKENSEEFVDYSLVKPDNDPVVGEVEAIALRAWRALGCRDGGRVDLRNNALGQPQFLEVNPLAGLHPTHSDLPMIAAAVGMNFTQLIGNIIESALTRVDQNACPCAV